MAAEWLTPTDEIIGLPCLVLPYDVPGDRVDYHHHFFPRRSPELVPGFDISDSAPAPGNMNLEDLASMALRMSRGQLLPRAVHELAHKKLLGPTLPQTVDDKFTTTIKACTGMVSRWAVDVRRPEDDMLVLMDDATFSQAASRRVLCTERVYYDRPANYRRQIFGNFFLQYALSKDLEFISPDTVDQFLDAKDDNRQRELGNLILKEALRARIDSVMLLHQRMVREGNIQPGRPLNVATSIRKLIHEESLASFYPILTERLLSA